MKKSNFDKLIIIGAIMICAIIFFCVLYTTENTIHYDIKVSDNVIDVGDNISFSIYDIRHGWFETDICKIIGDIWIEDDRGDYVSGTVRSYNFTNAPGVTVEYNTSDFNPGSYYIYCELRVSKGNQCYIGYIDTTWAFFYLLEGLRYE